MISCTDGISCTITLIVLASPYLVMCAVTPFRLKVYARYLAFTHLDRKTELLSYTVEGICAMQAICSFSFMAIGGFTDVLLILYALSMTCAWLCACVYIHKQVWKIPEWPENGTRIFGIASVVMNLLTLIVIPSPGALLAIPVLMLILSCTFVATIYLKEVFYKPAELDQLAMDRVTVDMFDGNPLVVTSDSANSPLIQSSTSIDHPPLPWWRRLWKGGSDGVDEKSRVSHDWFRVPDDDDIEDGRNFMPTSRHSIDSDSPILAHDHPRQQSNGAKQRQHLVRSAMEKHASPLNAVETDRTGKRSKSEESKGSEVEHIDDKENSTSNAEPSKAVIRALENQRKYQRSPNLPSSPPLKQPSTSTSISMAPRGQSNVQEGSRGVDGEYSVKVSGWRVRGADNDEDAHGRDRNCGTGPRDMSLQTYNDDDYDASPEDSLNSSKDTVDIHAETDRESGVEESESREYRRHLRVSSDSSRHSREGEEGEGVLNIEFAVEVTRQGTDAWSASSTSGWGDSKQEMGRGRGMSTGGYTGDKSVEIGRRNSDDSASSVLTTGHLGRSARSTSKSSESWTVWRSGAELLQLHASLVAVNEVCVPRKPRLKTVLHSSAVWGPSRKKCEQDMKSVAIFLTSVLRRKKREGAHAVPAAIPPAVLSFLEIKIEDRISLSAETD